MNNLAKLTPLPRLTKLRRVTGPQYVKVAEPDKCSHISAICSKCKHTWERMFTVEMP